MAEFIARLKQRKLVQWALAYIAFAFALIQVLDVVAQRFGWPDQIEKLLILALAGTTANAERRRSAAPRS